MVGRQGLPVSGSAKIYMKPGEWEVGVSYRGFLSNKHYQGREPFPELDPSGPNNRQHQINLDLTYALSDRFSLGLGIPLHFNDFELNRVPPGSPPGSGVVRDSTSVSGVGDITVRGRYWLFDTENTKRNLSVGLSLKLPTGDAAASDDIYGRRVAADWSVQPGDGAWGVAPSVEGFYRIRRLSLYGSALYLVNPKNTTGTPAFFSALFNRPNPPENSSTDQFAVVGGAGLQIHPKWPTPTLSYRLEGVPVSDLLGRSDGFRRPGRIGFVEPGVTYAVGRYVFSLSVPIRQYTNIEDSPTSARTEDATVPDFMVLVSFRTRF